MAGRISPQYVVGPHAECWLTPPIRFTPRQGRVRNCWLLLLAVLKGRPHAPQCLHAGIFAALVGEVVYRE